MPIGEPLDLVSSNLGAKPKVTSVEEHQPVIMEMDNPINSRVTMNPRSLLWQARAEAQTHLEPKSRKKPTKPLKPWNPQNQ